MNEDGMDSSGAPGADQAAGGAGESEGAHPSAAAVAHGVVPGGDEVNIDHFIDALPRGIDISGSNREIYDSYAKALAQSEIGPEAFSASLEWYQSHVASQVAEVAALDRSMAAEVSAELRQEWGYFFDGNVELIKNFLARLPPALEYGLSSARDENGMAVLNDPETLRWLARLARGGNAPEHNRNSASERAEIEEVMRTDRARYNADQEMQSRYRDLLTGADKGNSGRPQESRVESEIKHIEEYMRTDRRKYNADHQAQSRLRELYAARANTVVR